MTDSAPAPEHKVTPAKPGADGDAVNRLALRLIAANARVNAIALVVAIGLILLGAWAYSGIQQSLRDLRAAGLTAVLDAEVQALSLWIEDRKGDVRHWAAEPRIRAAVLNLTAGEAPDQARAALAAALEPALKESGAVAYNLIDSQGTVIASTAPEYLGRRISPGEYLAAVRDVLGGATRFVRPYREQDRIEGEPSAAYARPMVWFKTPVLDANGRAVAGLGFAHHADSRFTGILGAARPGTTGEVYAMTADGLMLSDSRHAAELRAAGALRPGSGNGALQVQIRDPGGAFAAGHRLPADWAAAPLTRLAALAGAARGRSDPAQLRGVVLEPYRNYRGSEVIGAWRWLADYDFAVAVEMSRGEAYAPLRYLNSAFGLLGTLLGAGVLAVLWSMWNVRRLRDAAGHARTIGQYRLERQIGEGAMGTVYLATHAMLKRPTAIKLLKAHLATDEVIGRFEREARLASQLVHPNTISIYDYGRTPEGTLYYVMEYLEGRSLDEIAAAEGPLPPARVIHVLRQVCAALREAHGRGLVHRDIKPHNLMLCQRGGEYDVVKILDFGLVKDLTSGQSRNITQFQRVVGTPAYMAPERIRNAADADNRSDIYSVGATAFHLLSGHPPYEAAGEHDLTYRILHAQLPSLQALAPRTPARLAELVVRCLARERSERPHDIVVLLAALEALAVMHPWTQRDAAACWVHDSSRAAS
jgi:eukaryotic-like serine/threonine-protein kinase